jgi:FkbM family methyltransferase
MGMRAEFLRKLSYNPVLIRVVRASGLRGIGRKLYYLLASPQKGVLRVECAGSFASFSTRSPEHLRAIEAVSLEPSLAAMMRAVGPGDVVYDIGSQFGVYSIFLAGVVGEHGCVVAFEPQRESFEQLQKNIGLNHRTNIRSYEQALGERSSPGKLYIGTMVGNSSLLPDAIAGAGESNSVPFQEVSIMEGDILVKNDNLPIPTAVKIDVEGSEYAVIKGLQKTLADSRCSLVCIEIHPQFLPSGISPDDIITILKSLGFTRFDAQPSSDPYALLAFREPRQAAPGGSV